jgi:hypothetical protein
MISSIAIVYLIIFFSAFLILFGILKGFFIMLRVKKENCVFSNVILFKKKKESKMKKKIVFLMFSWGTFF